MPSSSDSFTESDSDVDDSCHVQHSVLNEYEGFCPLPGITHVTDRVSADIKPVDFFEQYVKTRRPAVLSGLLKDTAFRGRQWTNSYLSTRAGEAKILVEDRKCANGLLSFGISSPKVEMKYGDFIKAVSTQETRYYLTTQDLERFVDDSDKFGLPQHIAAEPVLAMSDDYPAQPAVLGNLVPHQVSLWQGCTGKGSSSSSGLHHDFHDNLYLLIRGRKRFRLFPPSSAELLHVSGHLTKIHKNGLIVYTSPGASLCPVPVRADGAPMSVIARQKHQEAEQNLEEAEHQLEQLRSSVSVDNPEMQAQLLAGEKLVADCEQQMDSALEDLLRYAEDDQDSVEEDDSDNSSVTEEPATKQPKSDYPSSNVQSPPKLLDHFCNVELPVEDSDEPQTLFAHFDQPDKIGCMLVELYAGEMLYLPASWFHEVTSYDDSQSEADADTAGHLALNYWMYPPDGETFERPYADDFWPRHWAKISANRSCSKFTDPDAGTTDGQ